MGDTILDLVQAGLETVRGTGVAATRKVYATAREMSLERTLAGRPSATGTYFGRRQPSYSRTQGGLSLTDVLTYKVLPWWGQLMWKGGVAGVTDGGTPPAYAYTFVPTAAVDNLKSATIEGVDSGVPYQWKQAMVDTWAITWDSDSNDNPDWMLQVTMPTLKPVQQAVTGSIADFDVSDTIVARGTKVYVDSATIGTTQITGRAISGAIRGNNNLEYRGYAEDEAGPAANKVGRGEQEFEADLVLAFSSNAEVAEFLSDAPVAKKIRLERSHATAIHTTVFPRVRLDIYGYWSGVDFGTRGGERTVGLSFMGFYDTGIAAPFRAEIVNGLITLP
jgi:hypothetical protein